MPDLNCHGSFYKRLTFAFYDIVGFFGDGEDVEIAHFHGNPFADKALEHAFTVSQADSFKLKRWIDRYKDPEIIIVNQGRMARIRAFNDRKGGWSA